MFYIIYNIENILMGAYDVISRKYYKLFCQSHIVKHLGLFIIF